MNNERAFASTSVLSIADGVTRETIDKNFDDNY
jgi:hypothetical protein